MKSAFQITVIAFPVLLPVANSVADPGDTLEITESIVNLRSAPTMESDVLIKLGKERKVTELQRQGNWVEVNTNRDDLKSGWIHKSLLSKSEITANNDPETRFDRFQKKIEDQNEVLAKQNNAIYFSEAKNKGEGTIEIIATQSWLDLDYDTRSQTANELFKLWGDIYGTGYSISVIVVDEQGQQQMIMLR